MQFVRMNCNSCGAPLHIDLDDLQTECPHCGQRLMMDFELLGTVLAEREKTKRSLHAQAQETKRVEITQEQMTVRDELQVARVVIAFLAVAFIAALFTFPFWFPAIRSHMKLSKHNEVVEGLQRIERRVKNSIEEGDYDAALLEVLNLYCNDGYSKEETKEWDEKRDTYLEYIEEKRLEIASRDPVAERM